MPAEAALSAEEEAAITVSLLAFWFKTAESHARIITQTDNAAFMSAAAQAASEQLPNAPMLSQFEKASVGAAILNRNLAARRTTIAITETQLAAETTKATEAEVLSGVPPTIDGGTNRQSKATKRWDAILDEVTRGWHAFADGQVQFVSAPFVVNDEKLMYPGDSSMGASPENVINCRCSATYFPSEIAEQRLFDST